mgnify:CR=1 FL=1
MNGGGRLSWADAPLVVTEWCIEGTLSVTWYARPTIIQCYFSKGSITQQIFYDNNDTLCYSYILPQLYFFKFRPLAVLRVHYSMIPYMFSWNFSQLFIWAKNIMMIDSMYQPLCLTNKLLNHILQQRQLKQEHWAYLWTKSKSWSSCPTLNGWWNLSITGPQ